MEPPTGCHVSPDAIGSYKTLSLRNKVFLFCQLEADIRGSLSSSRLWSLRDYVAHERKQTDMVHAMKLALVVIVSAALVLQPVAARGYNFNFGGGRWLAFWLLNVG